MAAGAGALIGMAGQIFKALGFGDNINEWKQNALISLWNKAEAGDQYARDRYQELANPLKDATQPMYDLGGSLQGWGPAVMDDLFAQRNNTEETFRNAGGLYQTPAMEALINSQTGAADGMGQYRDIAGQGFAGGGWTPQYEAGFETNEPYTKGWGNNSQLALGDVGSNLIGQRGQTALTQSLQDRAMNAGDSGGRNSDLDYAMSAARGTLGNQGYNPVSGALANRGLDLASRESLLSPQEAVNFARESSVTASRAQQEKMYRQALNRGGGPGAVVAAGQQNQMLADFADTTSRNESEAGRNALTTQQQLQLQQAGLGNQMAQGGEQAAGSRMGQAFSAIPGTQSAANQFLQAMLSGGLGAGGLENDRMGTGTQMSNSLLSNMLGYGGLNNSMMQNQNQYALGLGGLYNQMAGTQGGLYNNAYGNYLGSGQLGVQRATNMTQAQQAALNAMTNQYGAMGNVWNNAITSGDRRAQGALGYAGQNLGLLGTAYGGVNGLQANQDLGGAMAGVGGLIGGFGNMFGGGGGGGNMGENRYGG